MPARAAEVAVDLERRMRVEEVGQRAVLEQVRQQVVGVVAVVEAGPEVDLPGHAPAGAAVAAAFERLACGGGQFGRGRRR